jgi:hypothetical protein
VKLVLRLFQPSRAQTVQGLTDDRLRPCPSFSSSHSGLLGRPLPHLHLRKWKLPSSGALIQERKKCCHRIPSRWGSDDGLADRSIVGAQLAPLVPAHADPLLGGMFLDVLA